MKSSQLSASARDPVLTGAFWTPRNIAKAIIPPVLFIFAFISTWAGLYAQAHHIGTILAIGTLAMGWAWATGLLSSLRSIFQTILGGLVGVTTGVLSAFGGLAFLEADSAPLETHFYRLGSTLLFSGASTPWVSPISEEEALAMTSDGEPFNEVRVVEGTSNPNHDLYLISTQGNPALYLGSINVETFVTMGAHPKGLTSHRILDMQVLKTSQEGGPHQFLLSFAATNFMENCRTTNLVLVTLPRVPQQPVSSFTGDIIFESPCFPTESLEEKNLSGLGGRIAVVPAAETSNTGKLEVLLTVGDYLPLSDSSTSFSHPVRTHSGTVLHIKGKQTQALVSGLRNPQGIAFVEFWSGQTEVMTSEHGPRGGDELNIIEDGLDYGWPNYSYGSSYGPNTLSDKPNYEGQSGGSSLPFFSWLPSIAPSQILQVEGPEFSKWWGVTSEDRTVGDVLVSSLRAESIYRLRIEGDSVRYVEPILIGERIRSFSQLPSGRLLLGTDSGKVFLLSRISEWDSVAGEFAPVVMEDK